MPRSQEIVIRPARKTDMQTLVKIDTFGKQLNSYRGLDKLDPEYKKANGSVAYFEKYRLEKDKWCYVAQDNRAIVGFILFAIEKRPDYFKIKRVGYLDLVFVIPRARGRGIARMLISDATRVLKAKGMRDLKLSVHSDNAAQHAWKELGFNEYRIDMWKTIR